MRKRLVAGLREVAKQVERNRIKIIFFAPDIQRCPETGGLDEAIQHILDLARHLDIPIVYALSRFKIGRILKKNVPVSCCGILNYQGTEETWAKLSREVIKSREEYQLKAQQLGLISVKVDENVTDTHTEVASNQVSETDVLLNLMKLSLKEK